MHKENFILYEGFNKLLSKKDFFDVKKKYLSTLNKNQYAIKESGNIYELINNIKRSPEKIGPYQKISVFEALNRIGSDLVLLSGSTKIFNGETEVKAPIKILLRMGNTHGFDFELHMKNKEIIYGEAFNAAESFCKSKMRHAIHKLIENPDNKSKEGVVFINKEVEHVIKEYSNKKENGAKMKIHRIYCGNME